MICRLLRLGWPYSKRRQKRREWLALRKEIERERKAAAKACREQGHSWVVGSHSVTFLPKDRTCFRCLRREVPLTVWVKKGGLQGVDRKN
ncbi:hypothetical protein [Tautonia plasticadhaerens]|uniref:Uncharacterized protein n=1 Tax=Tautonia plasticadhaerens TaxID=2527974 RepID=A0A518H2D2_9BACT|nr:hypothetical protein [Tautonia plasticadhaerens]QDV34977.1 hypothetical protein ElP_28740 [Tautonia plasticadhaerens]